MSEIVILKPRARSDAGTFRVDREPISDPTVESIVRVWSEKAPSLGLSVASAAAMIGLSSSTFGRILQGKSPSPPLAFLIKFAEVMKVPVETFFPNQQKGKRPQSDHPSLSELEFAASFLAEKNGTDPKIAASQMRLICSLIARAREMSLTQADSTAYEDAYNLLSREALATKFMEP